jgi:hypothetical protein
MNVQSICIAQDANGFTTNCHVKYVLEKYKDTIADFDMEIKKSNFYSLL